MLTGYALNSFLPIFVINLILQPTNQKNWRIVVKDMKYLLIRQYTGNYITIRQR